MTQLFTDNATSVLAAHLDATAQTITLSQGDGIKFPSPAPGDYAILTLTQARDETSWENVKLTARTGDVLTVDRGQEGTLPAIWLTGSRCDLRITASILNRAAGMTSAVSAGGTLGQVLAKSSDADYATEWVDMTGSGISSQTLLFNDASPVTLTTLAAGKRVVSVLVSVQTGFDGAGASVTVGTDAVPDLIVSDADLDITSPGTYSVSPLHKAVALDVLKIFITPGTLATTGEISVSLNLGD
jgi:hypothetical protein